MKRFETNAIRTQVERSQHREHAVPLYLTSSFIFNDAEQARALFAEEEEGNVYSRFSNPNASEFEEKISRARCLRKPIKIIRSIRIIRGSLFPDFLPRIDRIMRIIGRWLRPR